MIALVLFFAMQAATPQETLRLQAADLAAEADTLGAVASLDEALSGPLVSPDALLALGRFHLARGEAGPAVLALERAARLAPTDAEIASARREAYGLAGQVAPQVTPPFVAARTVTSRIGAGALVGLALVLYLATMALAFVWWRRRDRRLGWGALALAPVALAVLVVAALALWDAGAPRGVVLATVELRALPTPEAGTVGRLREGEVVETGGVEDGWRRVEAGETAGWVPARSVERL